MTYADNRELRKISNCFWRRGFQNNEFDNQEIVLKSLNFVLNVHSYWVIPTQHFVLEERMAESPESAIVLHNLLAKAKPAAQKRVCRFTGFRQRN
jgi:peptidyl-dipeptidase Dcp